MRSAHIHVSICRIDYDVFIFGNSSVWTLFVCVLSHTPGTAPRTAVVESAETTCGTNSIQNHTPRLRPLQQTVYRLQFPTGLGAFELRYSARARLGAALIRAALDPDAVGP